MGVAKQGPGGTRVGLHLGQDIDALNILGYLEPDEAFLQEFPGGAEVGRFDPFQEPQALFRFTVEYAQRHRQVHAAFEDPGDPHRKGVLIDVPVHRDGDGPHPPRNLPVGPGSRQGNGHGVSAPHRDEDMPFEHFLQ